MEKLIIFIGFTFVCCCFASISVAETGNGQPLKYISSCELDFNGDNESDIAFLVETKRDRELIVLIKTADGYDSHLVTSGKPGMYLSCHFGKTIRGTSAGKGNEPGQTYQTNGTYLQLTQDESTTVVYFWKDGAFKEVWTSD